MQEIKLKTQKREIIGRKVKQLRKQGLIPANIYGKKIKSQSLAVNRKDFEKVFAEAGETGIVKLSVEGETEERPVLIQNIQLNPVTEEPLHIDFRQLILTEKISANIPVELIGEALPVTEKTGILIQTINEIEVEALPAELPEKFVVDVSVLQKVGDEILVSQIVGSKVTKVEVKTNLNQVVAKIEPLAKEEVVPPPAEAPVEGETAVPAEGEVAPAKEAPVEEKNTKEEKKE